MKTLNTILLLFLSLSSLFSQEFIKNSEIHFKNKSMVKGDFYHYDTNPNIIEVINLNGEKQVYQISEIDFVKSKTTTFKIISYKGIEKLFEIVIEGEKISLYETNIKDKNELFVLKNNEIFLLETGKNEFKIDSRTYSKENNRYKGILKYLMSDNVQISNKIDDLNYNKQEISNLIIAYNEGKISYFKNGDTENLNKKSDWRFYSQYSTYTSNPHFISNSYATSFIQMGGELIVSEGSRHSLKFGVEYGKYNHEYSESWAKYLNININYLYDFYRMPNSNFYLGIRLFDIAKIWNDTYKDSQIFLRITPSFGYEYHVNNHLDLYIEMNHILQLEDMPNNFTIGISYDIKN